MVSNSKTKKTSREIILDSSIRIFSHVHISDVTFSSIARESGCGHSLVYHYFENVNKLFEEALTHVYNTFYPHIKFFQNLNINPSLGFVGMFTLLFDAIKKNRMIAYYYKFFFYVSNYYSSNKLIVTLQKEYAALLSLLIKEGQKQGYLTQIMTSEEMASSLRLTILGAIDTIILEPNTKTSIKPSAVYLPFMKGNV